MGCFDLQAWRKRDACFAQHDKGWVYLTFKVEAREIKNNTDQDS
jgi:hypothetical protein